MPALLRQKARFTLQLSFLVAIVANIAFLFGADIVMGVFGHAYAEHAGSSLRLMGIGIFGLVIKDHYITISRIQRRLARAARTVGAGTALELALAAAGAITAGINGLVVGWLIALGLESLVMVPVVYRTVITEGPQPVEGQADVS